MNQKLYIRLLFVSAFLCVVLFNEWNLSTLRSDSIPLREDTTIKTADDASYLRPVERLYDFGSLYTNDREKWTSIIRSPGYGFVYYGALLIVGKEHALTLVKCIQYLLYAISVVAFYHISLFLFKSTNWAVVVSLLYGFFPTYYGFLAYTLTEALTPALFILTYYFVVKGIQKKHIRFWIGAALLGGWLVLTRPALGLFVLPIPVIMWLTNKRKRVTVLGIALLLALPMASWQVRSKVVLGSFQSFHPIYFNELSGMYRLPHQSLWNLVKSWEYKSASFHSLTGPFWHAANTKKAPEKPIENFISKLPVEVRESVGETEWQRYLQLLYSAIQSSNEAVLSDAPLPEEIAAASAAYELKQKYISAHVFNYAIGTPFNVFKELTFHSNLPYYAIQGKYRGNLLVELLRWTSLMLYSFGILSLMCLPMIGFVHTKKILQNINNSPRLLVLVALLIPAFSYLIYLIFYQRGIEERYTTPILWVGLIGGVTLVRAYAELKNAPKK